MSGLQFKLPVRAIADGAIYPGGIISILDTDTQAISEIFADAELTVPLSNPLEADSAGYFLPIYLDPTNNYDITVTDSIGNVISSQEDFIPLIAPLSIGNIQPFSQKGTTLPLSEYTFYGCDTTTLINIFADEALTEPLDNPLTADESGQFSDIWLDVTKPARIILRDRNGVLLFDIEQFRFRVEILPPSAPVLSGEVDGDNINLTWTASISQFGTVLGYRLYDADTDELISDQPGLSYVDGPLTEGFTYSYYVIAYDANGNQSERSNIVSLAVHMLIEIITSSRDWIKPENLISVEATVIGAGGGGESGQATCGPGFPASGGGGGGGGLSVATFSAGSLTDVVAVTVGIGGSGGANVIRNSAGNSLAIFGSAGGDSSFGGYLSASGGKGGGLGVPSDIRGGAGGAGTTENGGKGGNGWTSNQSSGGDTGLPGASTVASGPGGGGGGVLDGFNVAGGSGSGGSSSESMGGVGGVGQASMSSSTTGEIGGTPESNSDGAGGGGAGGGCAGSQGAGKDATGGNGSSGGSYGAGGGGGGAAQAGGSATATSGAGGAGANGVIVLRYTYTT